MNNQNNLDRINALYHKSQAEGLTEAEKEEQAMLKKEFIANIRGNLRGLLNNIDMENEAGVYENLGEKYGKKHARNDEKELV